MTARVLVGAAAEAQILAIDEWWGEHRPAARALFREELSSAFELIATLPRVGRHYPHPSVRDVRRLLLRATRFHVYYHARDEAVVVLAVWSAVRGYGPELSRPG